MANRVFVVGESQRSVVRSNTTAYGGVATTELVCDGTGPTVVLLHGIYDRAQTWQAVLERLAAAGRRAVAVNLPPLHRRRVGEPILPALDSFVAAVVRANASTEGVVLVGNSMGAGLTLRAVLDPSLPIRAGIPIAVPGFGYTGFASLGVGPAGLPESVLFRMRAPRRLIRTKLAARAGAGFLTVPGRALPEGTVEHFVELFAGEPLGGFLAAGRALLREFDAGYPPGKSSAPLLFVHGRRDRLIVYTAAIRAARRYPSAKVRILAGSAHCPQLDDPDTTTELILAFADNAGRAA
ncbi:alpha/beta fold hydrolase [Nocardia iowensis]|uniref:Alpha/beta hydrolase n=1 Tax=Nocardia iowensis TaxID=204891 RepID=A0ABX8RI76_NOCIO|nr:alpha/beta hydrolase [Nocardia iowensis]QXN88677.1 alpha/beta hydrolase [Nocardia iowensis]